MPELELPYNSDAERGLLSCLFLDNTLIPECISRKLKDTDFYNKPAQFIYSAMLTLYYKNMSITPVTVEDELKTMKVLDVCWGIEQLYNLCVLELTTNAFNDLLSIVIARSKQRQFIREVKKILPMAYDTSSDDVMSKLRVATHWLLNSNTSDTRGWLIWTAFDKLVEDLKAGGLKPICNTGYTSLDNYTKGFCETAVWVVWARSWHWKSTFCLNLLVNACKQWIKCGYFSLEVNQQEISEKILSMFWKIPSQAFNASDIDERVLKRIEEVQNDVAPVKENLYVYDKLNRYEDIVSQIYALAWQWVKLFCVDHLLLVKTDWKRNNRVSELWDIVNGLKWIAQELDICIIMVSQFNRKVEDRMDKEPKMSDFNGSSDIENIANVAIGLQRMEYLEWDCCDEYDKNTMDCYILKNRKNPIGNIRFSTDMSMSIIKDLEEKDLNSNRNIINSSIEELSDSIEVEEEMPF